MISWTDQPPDVPYHPTRDLFSKLPFMAALRLTTGSHRLRVIVPQSVRADIFEHLRQKPIEMGGLLLGRVFKDQNGPQAVVIDRPIPSTDFNGTSVSLHMGTSVWNAARATQTSEEALIGWYHSHPNLGAFFSGTDRRTQRAFFTQPYSLGLVVDPIRNEEAWFAGPESCQLSIDQVIWLRTIP